VDEVRTTMPGLSEYDYEIILVNDCSPDGTFNVIAELAGNDEHITAVDLAKNFGQHAALMAGFHHCKGDIIVCLDDDGQTPANEVGKLLGKLEEGYDVVYASYETKQHSSFRNWGTKLNNKMTEIMLGKPKELQIPSYLAARRFIIEEMLSYTHCYPYVDGLILRTTRNICNVSVQHRSREEGESGYTLAKLIGLWMNGFTSFSIKPLRLATYFGCFTAFCGFLYAISIVIRYFTVHAAPLGWSSTTALLLIIGGIRLIVLGLIGEYVGRIFMCVNSAPQYVERQLVRKEELHKELDA
jgi:undecaprenyl-phosphate 4-deoxy-4-formamido-L-arabinose transferase